MAAESRLFEEARDELVIFDDEHTLLLEGSVAAFFTLAEDRVHVPGSGTFILAVNHILFFVGHFSKQQQQKQMSTADYRGASRDRDDRDRDLSNAQCRLVALRHSTALCARRRRTI